MKEMLSVAGTHEASTYLFQSLTSVEFSVIADEMAQLNDFCVAFSESVQTKINELSALAHEPIGGDFQDQGGETISLSADDIAFGAEVELETWRDTREFLAAANCLLLLSCFTEKSLSWLCQRLGEGRLFKFRGGQSKVASYLLFLKESCALNFEEPSETAVVREQCRELRNCFAHGEWDKCRKLVAETSLPTAFSSVTRLFESIESAYLSEPPDQPRGRAS